MCKLQNTHGTTEARMHTITHGHTWRPLDTQQGSTLHTHRNIPTHTGHTLDLLKQALQLYSSTALSIGNTLTHSTSAQWMLSNTEELIYKMDWQDQ